MSYGPLHTEETRAPSDESDEVILARSVSDPGAFAVLVERYEEAFLRKVRHILGDREEAADVVQDTFVKIYLNAHRFRPKEGASFKSWAYKILVNTCFSLYKKLKRERGARVDIPPELLTELPERDEERREEKLDREYLLSVVVRLPDLLRRAVTMHFLDGKPQREIAAVEGISEGAVRARIHRAKKELKKIALTLEERED